MSDGAPAWQRQQACAAILRVLADLAPAPRRASHDVSGSGPTTMAWLGMDLEAADVVWMGPPRGSAPRPLLTTPSTELTALQHYDDLTPGHADLALGWLWCTGTVEVEGAPVRICRPLATTSIESIVLPGAFRGRATTSITTSETWDLWPLVDDPGRAAALEADIQFGGGSLSKDDASQALLDRLTRLRSWTADVLEASGLPAVRTVSTARDPRTPPAQGLEVIAGFGVFVDAPGDPLRPRQTLGAWSVDPGIGDTAMAHLYLDPADPPPPSSASTTGGGEGTPTAVEQAASTLRLTTAQATAVLRARDRPVTVISGPPGTGKSQTAAALALDAVAQHRSVLVATQSRMAADVVAELLDRVPGPTPVLFGGGERASQLATTLADGLAAPHRDPSAAAAARDAEARRSELAAATRAELEDLAAVVEWEERSLTLPVHRDAAPALFGADPPCTAAEARARLHRASARRGPLASWRRRRARRAVLASLGSPESATDAEVEAAIDLAAVRERAHRAAHRDRSLAERRWAALVAADDDLRAARGRALDADVAQRTDGASRRAVAALASALRAGRAVRRAHLLRVDVRAMTQSLPLWVGTLGDIESMLPAHAGDFDVVILDEASTIEQPAAIAALLRARQVVVIGDPRQLRFVSFRSDAQIAEAVRAHGCEPVADKLDLRRVSVFDLAAGVAPVDFLDEHFRSVPHLIGFSAHRFYDDRLHVATRHPRNHDRVAIELRRVDGDRASGVNEAEVATAVRIALDALADLRLTVGIISPHRPQVDRLLDRLGDAAPAAALASGRLRVATVHGFQGSECDLVIASFGVSDATGGSRRFLEDPHLFNVLVTRARQRMIVLTSFDDPPPGILADYLRWASAPPPIPTATETDDPWVAQLARTLRDRGVAATTGYPAGRWTVDLVVGEGEDAVAVTTRVHPRGAAVHLERHLALAAGGWRQAEAFPGDHRGDPVAAALELAHLVERG